MSRRGEPTRRGSGWNCPHCGSRDGYTVTDRSASGLGLAALINLLTLGLARPFLDGLRFPHSRCLRCRKLVYVKRPEKLGHIKRY